ncbi:MAG: hypothetical protein HOP12_07615, partial [Candidatus Eisenbacteria bacterium]|nr:hypothetical protein [Candidatus Eisenbacteria bacterium]
MRTAIGIVALALIAIPTLVLGAAKPATRSASPAAAPAPAPSAAPPIKKVVKNEVEWRKLLSPAQYRVLREKGTE